MSARLMLLRLLPFAGLLAASGSGSLAWGQLASKSPFTPTQGANSGAPTANAPLEFRAYMETNEGVKYRLYDPATKTGTWVKLNEKNNEFNVTAQRHNGVEETLTVEHQGKVLTLALRKSKVLSAGAATPPSPVVLPSPTTNVPAAVTQAVVLNPTPADEAKRLEAVAAEVARRRALREAAAQQGTPGAAPAGQTAPVVNAPAAPQNVPYGQQPNRAPVQPIQRR